MGSWIAGKRSLAPVVIRAGPVIGSRHRPLRSYRGHTSALGAAGARQVTTPLCKASPSERAGRRRAKAKPATRPEAALRQTLAVVTAAVDLYRGGAVADTILEAKHRLDTRRYAVLRLILAGRRYPSQIADAMYLPPSGITRALQALVAEGYVVRTFDQDDSRRTRLTLTHEGENIFKAATRSLSEWIAPQLSDISEAEFDGFVRTVAAFTEPPRKEAK